MKKIFCGLSFILLIFIVLSIFVPKGFAACDGVTFDGCANFTYACTGGPPGVNEYRCNGPKQIPATGEWFCEEEYVGYHVLSCDSGCNWSTNIQKGCTTYTLPCYTDYGGRGGTCCQSCPACTPTSCNATCPTSCGYGGGTATGTDNCGNSCSISCGSTPACCSPNCNDSGNYCVGVGYTGNCGQGCTGTQAASCTNPATVCIGVGITPSNGCGSCPSGTLGPVCANPATVCSGVAITSSNACNTSTCTPGSACACAPGTKCDTPGQVALSSPANAAEVAGTAATLTYSLANLGTPCGGSGTYRVCVDGVCNNTASTSYGYTGAAGNHNWNVNYTNYCGATGTVSASRSFCLETWTSARVSGFGAWGACNASHVRTRTRTCTEDCSTGVLNCSNYFASNCPAGSSCATTGGGLSWTQTETQTCYGQMTGTFFDASDLPSCAGMAGAPKISGGTINLTGPTSYGPYTTNAAGVYTTAATILSPDTYTLSVDPGATYITAAKFNCQGTSLTLTGSASGCLTQPCETAPTTTHDFGFWRVYGGWWQGVGGSVYGGAGVQSVIPGTVAAAERYLILPPDGLTYYRSGTVNLGTYPGVTVSTTGLVSQSGYTGDNQDYDYFVSKMATFDKITWNGSGKPTYVGANGYDIYTYTGDVTMNWAPAANEKAIYLIDGNVTVSGNISIPSTGTRFLAVIASGTITFNTNVSQVDGWWVGNSLAFPSAGVKSDVQFNGGGSFIGWNSVSLARDQTGTLNNTQPAEKFTYRPDFLINAPEPMLESRYVWRQE